MQEGLIGVGEIGERWGDFVFVDADHRPIVAATPSDIGPVDHEEVIPDGHPGFRSFTAAADMQGEILDPHQVPLLRDVPQGYELAGIWVVVLEDGRVSDLQVSYVTPGGLGTLLGADLSVGWTDRAPRPLPASTVALDLPTGVVMSPVQKAWVGDRNAVFQEATNPEKIVGPARVKNSLNWFDGGRLWYVQGEEPFDVLLKIAESFESTAGPLFTAGSSLAPAN